MAVVTAAIANEGRIFRPFLVKKLISPGGVVLKEFSPQLIRSVPVDPENLRLVREAMAGVINEPGGTGGASRLWGIVAAGKTGTAQVVSLGKKGARDHAWFVAFAPLESPVLALAIIAEHGGHGGDAAAPIARKIFEVHFNLPVRGTKPAGTPSESESPPQPPSESLIESKVHD
jgi:penicillin-binding protein 2